MPTDWPCKMGSWDKQHVPSMKVPSGCFLIVATRSLVDVCCIDVVANCLAVVNNWCRVLWSDPYTSRFIPPTHTEHEYTSS